MLNFDAAVGHLIFEPNKGLEAMFMFMNTARIGTAIQGIAHAEASFQGALAYARERRSMRAVTGKKEPNANADALIWHADVRRMLLTQKAIAELGRAMIYAAAQTADLMVDAGRRQDRATHAAQRCTKAPRVSRRSICSAARSCCGRAENACATSVASCCVRRRPIWLAHGSIGRVARATAKRAIEWNLLTQRIMRRVSKDRDLVGSASVDYLLYSGDVMMAHFWVRRAAVAQTFLRNRKGVESAEFYRAKIQTAEFYFDRLLPLADAHRKSALAPTRSLMQMGNGDFAFS